MVRVCSCTSTYLCYWPAGNILQLLISAGAENEGYRVVFSLLHCFPHLSLPLRLPHPAQAAFPRLFYLPKPPDTRLGETFSCSLGYKPCQEGCPPTQKHARPRLMQGKNWWGAVIPSDSQAQGNPLLKLGGERRRAGREFILPPSSSRAPSALQPSPSPSGVCPAPKQPPLPSVRGDKEISLFAFASPTSPPSPRPLFPTSCQAIGCKIVIQPSTQASAVWE